MVGLANRPEFLSSLDQNHDTPRKVQPVSLKKKRFFLNKKNRVWKKTKKRQRFLYF